VTAVLGWAPTAAAETYVEAPTLAHAYVGASLRVSAALALPGASQGWLSGAGVDTYFTYRWESGWAVTAAASWIHFGNGGFLVNQLDGADHADELTGVLAGRKSFGGGDVAPFVGAALSVGDLHMTSGPSADSFAVALGANAGVAIRAAGWESFLALEVRRARYEGIGGNGAALYADHLGLVFGAEIDLGLR
jgi:hypothetical protein